MKTWLFPFQCHTPWTNTPLQSYMDPQQANILHPPSLPRVAVSGVLALGNSLLLKPYSSIGTTARKGLLCA